MESLYITKEDWKKFIKSKLNEFSVFAPFEENGILHFEKVNSGNIENISYKTRAVEPLKLFLFPFKERVFPEIENFPKVLLIGVTSCDLKAIEILDKVFAEGDFKDPNYSRRKENTIFISIDCQKPYDTCFCTLVGNKPYPSGNFDLNLTEVNDGFVVEVGSERGKELIGNSNLFTNASSDDLEKRDKIRKDVEEKVKEINKEFDFENVKERLRGLYRKEDWENIEDIKNCVQCGSCNFNCPTCVCFLLEDFGKDGEFKKVKVWDACLYPGYARMASGASPRPTIYERYGNRVLCKYWYMVENFGILGCTGCGRCISGCIGKIDKRKVISEIGKEKVKNG